MLHLTRTWNSVTAVAFMRRGLALARDYARQRIAFGAPLARQPLHVDTLAWMQAEMEAAFHLCFYLVELIGRDETGKSSAEEAHLLRLLTSIVKLTTGRQAVMVASEVLEAHGGAGYVEDTGLPLLLRDSQVLPIWEGTTNVLALDTLRAIAHDVDGLAALQEKIVQAIRSASSLGLVEAGQVAEDAMHQAFRWLQQAMARQGDYGRSTMEAGARRFALTLGRSLALALLVEHAQWSLNEEHDGRAQAAARRFAQTPVDLIRAVKVEESIALANDEPLAAAMPHHVR
jgi:hypothetical protein